MQERFDRLEGAHAADEHDRRLDVLPQRACPRQEVRLRLGVAAEPMEQEVLERAARVHRDVGRGRVGRSPHHVARDLEPVETGADELRGARDGLAEAERARLGCGVDEAELHRHRSLCRDGSANAAYGFEREAVPVAPTVRPAVRER